MKKEIRLVALDMDGTLFNQESRISEADQAAILRITGNGAEVAISTGRPYAGLPVPDLLAIGIRYAITTNGAAVYRLADRQCLASDCMDPGIVTPVIDELQKKSIHIDAFIDGDCYCPVACRPGIDRLDMPESIRRYIRETRTFVPDLAAFIRERRLPVQKMTLNFYPLPDGSFGHRSEVMALLSACPAVTWLSGGYHNLEFTRSGVTKGTGLRFLCEYLKIDMEQTMACGDTQNDMDILKTAGIGVAMGNATPEIREIADYVTLSNEESGVAHAISRFL